MKTVEEIIGQKEFEAKALEMVLNFLNIKEIRGNKELFKHCLNGFVKCYAAEIIDGAQIAQKVLNA